MEQNKEYYNEVYSESPDYNCSYKESKYFFMWQDVIKNLNKKERIADLGCGVGQFAEMLIDNGFNYSFGVDFSETAIDMCKRLDASFYVGDLLDEFNFKEYDTAIIFEVLEHIEKDLGIIERIPSGKRVIFSVPNFDDPAHVRTFQNGREIYERYSHLIEIEKIETIQVRKRGNIIFTAYGTKI